jgi:putative cardiolipin synthase
MGEFSRINRRMHNKSMTFDNQATIVGGRNIGAEYFSAREDSNYNDLDVLGFGPVAQDVSFAFDSYWNNPVAVPVSAFLKRSGAGDALIEYRSRIAEIFENAKRSPYGGALQRTIIDAIDRRELELTWSAATVVADPPDKSKADFDNIEEQLSSILGPAVTAAQTELVVVSPYFVPRDSGVAMFRELTARGVRVIIVTNSLAATDVTAVHSGYVR